MPNILTASASSTGPRRSRRKRASFAGSCWILGALALGGCGGRQQTAASAELGPIQRQVSDARSRKSVSITVYNSNFGLVREERVVELGEGRVALAYRDVAANIQPETVHIVGLDEPSALTVLEQNYRYDLLTPETLLKKYVGKTLRVYRYNETSGKDEEKVAELLSVEGGPVLRIDGQVTTNYQGRFAFPSVPENLVEKPTLEWLLASTRKSQRVEVTYLTQNLSWVADYVLVVDAQDKLADLTGWVTLSNTSGADYQNATLKLVAGDVQRVTPPPQAPMPEGVPYALPAAPAPAFKEEGLFEYHLYALQRPTHLLDKEQKQVALLEGHAIGLQKQLILRGAPDYFRGQYGEVESNKKVGVYLNLENTNQNHLGMPLPKGTVRVYKADASGAQQFLGEDSIDHTPRDEELHIKLGEVFDVVADRKQISWSPLGTCASESTWEIELRNHKAVSEVVRVDEPTSGEWEILSASHAAKREDASTVTFSVPVAARAKTKLTYKIRVRWC